MEQFHDLRKSIDSDMDLLEDLMTGRSIDGESIDVRSEEVNGIERLLEKPLPDRLFQEQLLQVHGRNEGQSS